MKALLICPSERPDVQVLAKSVPLAEVPLLGQGLLEYWLTHLAASGIKQVLVLAYDRPEIIQARVGKGGRWGLAADVIAESRELTPAQALLKYSDELGSNTIQNTITVLDHFPGLPEHSLFASYAGFFAGVQAWIPHARTPDRVGFRELQPGVYVGLQSIVSPEAQLHAPCWIGKNVIVGAGASVGPAVIVEDGSFIEPAAEISHSYIGPDTFVGRYAEVVHSLAWGNTLVNWQTGSVAVVPDAFVLCALRPATRLLPTAGWLSRLAHVYSRNKGDVLMVWKHLLMNKES